MLQLRTNKYLNTFTLVMKHNTIRIFEETLGTVALCEIGCLQ